MRHRGRERWFHLTVSVFALVLAAASGLAIEYQKSPDRVRAWLTRLDWPSVSSLRKYTDTHVQKLVGTDTPVPNSVTSGSQTSNTTGTTTSPGTSNDPATGTGLSAADTAIRVEPFNNNVSQTSVSNTQQLLTKYHIQEAIAQFLGFNMTAPATVELVQNKKDYESALKSVGVNSSQVHHLSLDTGGFTTGAKVIIPLFQNTTTPQLVNTLTHELTHVYLNENGGALPSWLNEGMAVTMGMQMESRSESAVQYTGYAKRMAENVLQAVSKGQLQPLTGNESQVIQGKASYDLELQDWLALRMMILKSGEGPIHNFLSMLHGGTDANTAFRSAFGMTQKAVNTNLTKLLQSAVKAPDKGVDVTLNVKTGFHGFLRLLPHGSQTWAGFSLQSGKLTFTLLPDGTLHGISGKVTHTADAQAPDNETVYLNLDSSTSLTYQGKKVKDAGFALDYHNGLYGYVNSWITLASGKTLYLSKPDLFGVQLQRVTEQNQSNSLLPLLST